MGELKNGYNTYENRASVCENVNIQFLPATLDFSVDTVVPYFDSSSVTILLLLRRTANPSRIFG